MKRPPGIWILLSAGVLWLSLQNVYGIRATSLIFARSTTTTTPAPVANVTDGIPSSSEAEEVTELSTSNNVTKPTLTGIPQIDYVYDPNLPKELNGYNLSEYPFYERVPDPEEIDFKCDGLHDGFYASIKFKCQVYHHCLFGTRYDFLCANYTAFDQKTFICQFVSDVDCVGSKKFWHRNDALYQAASTTTPKPLNIYTQAPQTNPVDNGGGSRRDGGKRRRPLQRRPQYDYYEDEEYDDEYYEDRPRSRRRRPRPRPRPVYDDEYEDEYDEMYERRNRRPYNRRRNKNRPRDSAERTKDKKKHEEDEDYEYQPTRKRKPSDEEKTNNEDEYERKHHRDEEEKRNTPRDEPSKRRKPMNTHDERSKKKNFEYEDEDDYEIKHHKDEEEKRNPSRDEANKKRKNEADERSNKKKNDENEEENVYERKHQNRDEDEKRIPPPSRDESSKRRKSPNENKRKQHVETEDDYEEISRPSRRKPAARRPIIEDDYEEKPPKRENRPRKKDESEQAIIKPTTGTIYDRPRLAPRIKPPVPKNEANKYAYKPISTKNTRPSLVEDEEYYDEYEDDLPAPPPPISKNSKGNSKRIESNERKQASTSRRTETTLDEEDDALTLPQKTRNKPIKTRGRFEETTTTSTTKKPVEEEHEYYDDEYEIEKNEDYKFVSTTSAPKKKWKPSPSINKISTRHTPTTSTTVRTTTTTTPSTTTTPTTESYRERNEQVVRIVKRPFLPSRGGNPYSSRGLQPVGFKAAKPEIMEPQQPQKSKFSEPISENDDDFKPIKKPVVHILRPINNDEFTGPRTTQKPKIVNPLDLNEDDYDVTLNDALNPTLPNLPIRSNYNNPTSYNPANDYTFSAFQRQRYVLEPVVSSANSDYIYQQTKQPNSSGIRQRFEAVSQPSSYSRDQFVAAANNDYKYYNNPQHSKRGITQAFYTSTGYHHR